MPGSGLDRLRSDEALTESRIDKWAQLSILFTVTFQMTPRFTCFLSVKVLTLQTLELEEKIRSRPGPSSSGRCPSPLFHKE
ncbi:hypothetical protein MHYP_G00270380 [Metynnis hypsauchen]